jgi:hypothetical protein
MPESFLRISPADRREALNIAASQTGRPANLLEKDVWVVQALDVLYSSKFGPHLVFKGGTALSKVHRVIDRFSEDVDITYDIRELTPDETAHAMERLDVIPENRSQQSKLSALIREERFPEWIKTQIVPLLKEKLSGYADLNFQHESDTVLIEYPPSVPSSKYAAPTVRLEFGGRSTGEPASPHKVVCDMAAHLPDLLFPTATPRTMEISRIFWEKATAIHVYCLQGKEKLAERFSRHLYDLACLREKGYTSEAIAAKDVAETVAKHKAMFFRMKAADGNVIDYTAAIGGSLLLIPNGADLDALRKDYQSMIEEGLLREDAYDFNELIAQCTSLQKEANKSVAI